MRKYLSISAFIIIADQLSKVWIKTNMSLGETRNVIGDFFRLTFVENPGMAFGINFGMPVVLTLFSLVASGFIIYILKKSTENVSTGLNVSLALILGGALGNFIDRAFYGVIFKYAEFGYGKVVDFLDFDIPDLNFLNFHLSRFYVFNIADAAVSIGMVLLFFFYPKEEKSVNTNSLETSTDAGFQSNNISTSNISTSNISTNNVNSNLSNSNVVNTNSNVTNSNTEE